jgi:DNA-binding HxlR family transcriptional regulator
MKPRTYDCSFGCPVEATLDVIGGKWKGVLLFLLLERKRRFGELRKLLPDVTQRVLTLQLRELEREGIVKRTVYPEVPPRVEYAISDFGASLKPIILAMRAWGEEYRSARIKPREIAAAECI